MALHDDMGECPECGCPVEDQMPVCPECGFPLLDEDEEDFEGDPLIDAEGLDLPIDSEFEMLAQERGDFNLDEAEED